jgi:hypothetical protein
LITADFPLAQFRDDPTKQLRFVLDSSALGAIGRGLADGCSVHTVPTGVEPPMPGADKAIPEAADTPLTPGESEILIGTQELRRHSQILGERHAKLLQCRDVACGERRAELGV